MQIQEVKYLLYVADMDRAIAFWSGVIGLGVRLQSPWWSELTHGGSIVALHGGGDTTFRNTGLGLQVADIEAACEEVAAGGGTIRRAPARQPGQPIKLADLTDTEGNGFQLSQYVG